uniref:Uncharacterized protein n=1 Tax=Cyprinus carpio TaxID=7962 RepID=A0A8C1LRS9_CYPCA
MDEMDLPQMKKEVESLKYQLAFKREKSSKTVTEFFYIKKKVSYFHQGCICFKIQ